MVEIKVDLERCTGCGTCVDVCPVEVFGLENEKSVVVNSDECIECRVCESDCSENAIEVKD